MEKHEIVAGIKEILLDSLRGTVTIEDMHEGSNLLEEIKMDSIQAMEILLRVEEKFDIMIDDDDLNRKLFSSLSFLGDYVMKKIVIQ
jgi:acyl carrier protein